MGANTDTLTVRLPSTEAEAVRERAEENGLSLSEYMRRLLTGGGDNGVSAAVESAGITDPVALAVARRYAAALDMAAGTLAEVAALKDLGPKLTALIGLPAKGGAAPPAPAPTPTEPAAPVSTLGALRDEVGAKRAQRAG